MAYLLSLYPSKSFDPSIPKESSFSETYQSLLSVARATFPGWMTFLLPSPSSEAAFAPVPTIPELTPEVMKKALVILSSKGKLSELPANTVNYLIYNNATALKTHEEFWASLF
jgi:cerevisin